jgi:hypothetical protein
LVNDKTNWCKKREITSSKSKTALKFWQLEENAAHMGKQQVIVVFS